ncbi:PAS domain S-box protein [Haloarchaeobius sp. HME9146]|uniref:PAS domain S-box protein n=1 Tax=Haloarchaeobius sp. HME9146 TaxID=2978732 RepID=UPI0021C07A94|nr:PAS domain S-box protein [Haloarchaeobius sp. HME9146]MCT9097878.1 PAS domain S-box protein [Haloarchaeobius sp. HME9146]
MTDGGTRVLVVGFTPDEANQMLPTPPERVVTAADTATALDAVTSDGAIDCVVSDYQLPDGDAFDLYDALSDGTDTVPFLLYTAEGDETVAGRALAAGMDAYVPASDGVDTLQSRLAAALDSEAATVDRDRLELVYEQAPLAIVESDPDGNVAAWNDGATDLFGHTRAEALGENLIDLVVPPEERAVVREVCERNLSRAAVDVNVNGNVTKDGDRLTCEWYNTSLTDEDGNIVGSLSFVQNVTDRVGRRETVEDLQAMSRELIRIEERERVAEFAVEAARSVLDQTYTAVLLYDECEDVLVPAATTDEAEAMLADTDEFDGDKSLTWEVFASGEATIINERANERTLLPEDSGMQSTLVVPLGDHGVLAFADEGPDGFDQTEAHLAGILASTTTAALDRSAQGEELRRQQAIVEAAGDAVFALDEDAYFRTVNDAMTELTGYDRESLLDMPASEILDAEYLERGRTELLDLIDDDDRDSTTFEVEVQTADGDRVPCEATLALLPDESSFDGTAVVVRDITERKRMADELVEQKRKIENLHGVASDLDDCETEAEIWDLTVEAAEGILDFDICGVDRVEGEYLVSAGISSEIEPQGYKKRSHVSDGIAGKTHRTGRSFLIDDIQGDNEATPEHRTYRSLLSVPIDDKGVFQAVSDEVAGFDESDLELAELLASHVADAIEQLQFEAQLLNERDLFAALFENVPDPVVYAHHTDDEPVIQEVNAAFERVFGYKQAEIAGEPLDDLIVPPDRHAESDYINERSQAGELVEQEVKRRTTDGLRDFLMTVVPVEFDAKNPRTFGVYTDITERKERQKRVEILNRVLRHDLRNGMNIIRGSAEMLADVVEGTTAVGYAETILSRADDLVSLAEKTRAVERTLDRDHTATGPVDLHESVQTAISRLTREYPQATITTDLPEDAAVRADDLLRTAIYHVIENALQHNDTDDPHVHVTALQDEGSDQFLRLSVADNGPGIPEEERALIAEEQEITQLRHASGLGLWLVNWVVTQCGGWLSFEDNDPRGTVVTMTVPLAVADETVQPADD